MPFILILLLPRATKSDFITKSVKSIFQTFIPQCTSLQNSVFAQRKTKFVRKNCSTWMRIQKYLVFRADDANAPIFLCNLNQNLLEHASNSASISFGFLPSMSLPHDYLSRCPEGTMSFQNFSPTESSSVKVTVSSFYLKIGY
jgi:hypothetical protein